MSEEERFHETRLDVRFQEVDSYDVVWHGHYAAWLEIARGDVAARFGISHRELSDHGYELPIVSIRVDYKRPALQGDSIVVKIRLREPRTALLHFDYQICRADGTLLATAESRQVILNRDRDLLVTFPAVVKEAIGRIRAFHRGS